MADTPGPNPPAEDDMHWGIAYLREDIQDLRLGLRVMHERMDRLAEASNARIGAVNDNLSNRIEVVNDNLSNRIEAVNDNLSNRIEVVNDNLSNRIDAVSDDLSNRIDAGNKVLSDRIDSRFAVLLTAMIALIGISIGANFTFLQMYLPTH